jgi:hypothetical protein
MTAVSFVILLIGSFSLLCIGAITLNDRIYFHGSNVEQIEGKIVAIGAAGSAIDFVLETASGQHIHFHCSSLCHASLKHLQRHLYEQAATYVFYIEGANKSLMAINID